MSKLCVFDIEGDGLSPSKIHCLTAAIFSQGEWRFKTTTDYQEMRDFFTSCDFLVGHNIIRFDIPAVERILGIKVEAQLIDTLGLSWYLYPEEPKHGLGDWGEYFGIPKPVVKEGEWKGPLPGETHEDFIKKMKHRCQEDVKINCKLWDKQKANLLSVYGTQKGSQRIIKYLMFKLKVAQSAVESRWKLDVLRCREGLEELELEKAKKEEILISGMPKRPIYKTANYPKIPFKKNGELSTHGQTWYDICQREGRDPENKDSFKYIGKYEEPNPNSTVQIKDWLYSLGWEPENFTYTKDGRSIPQIRVDKKGEKVLCPSVRALVKKAPALEALEGITVVAHRIGILQGFLKAMDDEGYIKAEIVGFTNTLRFRHKTVVNLPAASRPYGDLVRGVLIAEEGYELCGSDMSSLEDRTKQHYMWKHDPEYVKEMQTPDFDPHLALAQFAGALTPEQVKAHKEHKEDHGQTRHLYKTANYSCTYGAGGAKLALTLKISKEEGTSIVEAYRKKNWAINAIAKECITKEALGTKWLFNPVSKLWYSLRDDKDRFSTLNQGTGVYCFDMWIKEFFDIRPQITGQMHDEVILQVEKGKREEITTLLKEAVSRVNEKLQLNRDLDVDVQFGDNYAEIH